MPKQKEKERKKKRAKEPPQVDSLDRGKPRTRTSDLAKPRPLEPDSVMSSSGGYRPRRSRSAEEPKWTAAQEMQLLKKRTVCLAHKWMHYRMSHFKSIIANILGFPLVVISGIATAAQYYSQLEGIDCTSSGEPNTNLSAAGVMAMVFTSIVTVLTAMVAWLKPSEAAEIHRQVSITYQSLVEVIEDEMATKEEEREEGRYFMHDIESKMEVLAQTAPNVPWFIMRNYTTDWADERERELKIRDEPRASEERPVGSRSFRLDRVDRSIQPKEDEENFDLMENFCQRLQTRVQQERSAALQYELERAQEIN